MKQYDVLLDDLRNKMAKKSHLEAILPDMRNQRQELEEKTKLLEDSKKKEEHDVAKIEGGSLASFFFNVVGKKDEKLDKERQEAYEARIRYDVAMSELAALNADIDAAEYQLKELFGCEVRYKKVFDEKFAYLMESDPNAKDEICGLEEKLTLIQHQEVEIQEAICAGEEALRAANEVLDNLGEAKAWSTWDMIGGGILGDIRKYEALDEAQLSVETLQVKLRKFKTELTDVTISADMDVRISGFLQFADFFFDGLFSDWKVRDEINCSIDNVQVTCDKIEDTLVNLRHMKATVLDEKQAIEKEIEQVVLNG